MIEATVDGLIVLNDKLFVVADGEWKVQAVSINEKKILLDQSARKIQSADMCYIASKRILVIPTFFESRMVAYHLFGRQ
ncbi:MAG: hypothetical protein Q8859_10845 [Bacteroidota bacterium]|nr:hypothetical protein [Bacteroidota bacterium]